MPHSRIRYLPAPHKTFYAPMPLDCTRCTALYGCVIYMLYPVRYTNIQPYSCKMPGSRRFFLTLPSGFTPGGGVGTAFPLDPPLDRQGGTGPGAGARCRRPSEVKGGGRRDGGAESRPHRCPRGILGANGLERGAPLWEFQLRHNGQFYFPVFLNTLYSPGFDQLDVKPALLPPRAAPRESRRPRRPMLEPPDREC